jgi:excisionase family DNA binding protein
MSEDRSSNVDPNPRSGELEPSPEGEPQCDAAESNGDGLTIISADDAAKLLGINRNTLYAGANAGEVPCRRIGRKFLFVREVLIEWLRHEPAA